MYSYLRSQLAHRSLPHSENGIQDVAARRVDIDGLRAVAILFVLGFHFFPDRIPGGFIGVDIFFVISGYLITKIILKELDDKNFSFLDFYGRRVRRLFPCLVLVL